MSAVRQGGPVRLPEHIRAVVGRLTAAGFKAYVVGGAVRDALMGRKPADYDVCTSALPAQTAEVFADAAPDLADARYGTVRVCVSGRHIEITTMRREGGYSDGRRPDTVEFCDDIEADLLRRDFTVNAIACDRAGRLTDPTGGREDIRCKLIRTVGDPRAGFSDDALRILRMLRFCARLGFEAEGETERAARELRRGIARLSPERVRDELSRLLMCENAGSVIHRYREIIFEIIPELRPCDGFLQHNPNHCYDVLGHICATVDLADRELSVRLAALLHDVGKPRCFTISESGRGRFVGHMELSAEMARGILTRLRYPQKIIETVCVLVENHDKPHEANAVSARRWLNRIGSKNVFLVLKLKRADCLAHAPCYHNRLGRLAGFRHEVKAALARGDCYSLSALAVNGRDVMRRLGLEPGERTGEMLRYLLERVMDGTVKNERAALLRAGAEKLQEDEDENSGN